jgi:hypothetical protein
VGVSAPSLVKCCMCVGVVGCSGGVLLSHDLSVAVPSALEGLASGFGMGPGVSPPLCPPEHPTTPTGPVARLWGGVCGRWDMHSGREHSWFVTQICCRVTATS